MDAPKIDWTKYGRGKPKLPGWEVHYYGDGVRTWATATFPLERFEEVRTHIEKMIQEWKDHP